MTSTLSFTILGKKADVEKQAALFMSSMGKIIGKEINGTMLVKLERHDNSKSKSLKQICKAQANELFNPEGRPAVGVDKTTATPGESSPKKTDRK